VARVIKFLAGIRKRGSTATPHLTSMAAAAHSLKLYDTLAEATRATNARNARSPHRMRGFWVAAAVNDGFTVRWVGKARTRSRHRFAAARVMQETPPRPPPE
jgi:hypothetical protein